MQERRSDSAIEDEIAAACRERDKQYSDPELRSVSLPGTGVLPPPSAPIQR
jgi:hypothetical protein